MLDVDEQFGLKNINITEIKRDRFMVALIDIIEHIHVGMYIHSNVRFYGQLKRECSAFTFYTQTMKDPESSREQNTL